MNLIKISNNVLVNPDSISCVEQKVINKKTIVIIWVEGKSYTLDIPLMEFLNILDNINIVSGEQHFAG